MPLQYSSDEIKHKHRLFTIKKTTIILNYLYTIEYIDMKLTNEKKQFHTRIDLELMEM